MIQLSSKDLKELREKWWKDQDGICPILGKYYDLDKFCIDHQHKLKAELPDETGKGCVEVLLISKQMHGKEKLLILLSAWVLKSILILFLH